MNDGGNGAPATCGRCRHFHELPRDPRNLGVRFGQCREGPPQAIPTSNGLAPVYVGVPFEWPACSRFLASLQVVSDGR